MIDRTNERRQSQALFYDAAVDRRTGYERRKQEAVPRAVPALPGAIRPGVGEAKPPVERRRYLDGGAE